MTGRISDPMRPGSVMRRAIVALIWAAAVSVTGGAFAAKAADTAEIKESLFRDFDVLVSDHDRFSIEELGQISEVLHGSWLAPFGRLGKLTMIQAFPKSQGGVFHFGSYNPFTHAMTLVPGGPHFRETVIHEVFHALAEAYPGAYVEFQSVAGWSSRKEEDLTYYVFRGQNPEGGPIEVEMSEFDLLFEPEKIAARLSSSEFPSRDAKLGPAEMFAECGTATVLLLEKSSSDNYQLQQFSESGIFGWIAEFLRRGTANR